MILGHNKNYTRNAFVEATLYDALPERAITTTDPLDYRTSHIGKYKDTSIRWEQGKNSIELGEISTNINIQCNEHQLEVIC